MSGQCQCGGFFTRTKTQHKGGEQLVLRCPGCGRVGVVDARPADTGRKITKLLNKPLPDFLVTNEWLKQVTPVGGLTKGQKSLLSHWCTTVGHVIPGIVARQVEACRSYAPTKENISYQI